MLRSPPQIEPAPLVQVRVLANIYVRGQMITAGNLALMASDDARQLRSVGRVEFLES
jgi:hypothetical protein